MFGDVFWKHHGDSWGGNHSDDHQDDEDGPYARRLSDNYQPRVRCNRCGSADVRWRQQTGKWVLFNLGVGEHVCKIDDSSFSAIEP